MRATWLMLAVTAMGCGAVRNEGEPDAGSDATCTANETRCDGNTPATCTNGAWVDGTACADQTCVAGACEGMCAPGQTQCTTQARSACDATGQWTSTDLGEPIWQRTFGGADDEAINLRAGLTTTPDGNFLIAGSTGPVGGGNASGYLVKFTPSGDPLWTETVTTASGAEAFIGATASPDGVYACGSAGPGALGCTAGRVCGQCARFDESGTMEWQSVWPGTAADVFQTYEPIATANGFLVAGTTTDGDPWLDAFTMAVDANGTASPETLYHRDGEDAPLDFIASNGGTFLGAGYTGAWRSCEQPWVFQLDASAALIGNGLIGPCAVEAPGSGGTQRSIANGAIQLADGSVIVVGTQYTPDRGTDAFIAKIVDIDSTPSQLWRQELGGAMNDNFTGVVELPDGGFLAIGTTASLGAGGTDMFVVRTDGDGNELWQHTYGGAGDDSGWAIAPAPDGSYLLVGMTSSMGAGGSDLYVLDIPGVCS